MTMTLTLSTRDLNPFVNYINPVTNINFTQSPISEVKKEKQIHKNTLRITCLTSISTLGIVSPVFAQTSAQSSQIMNSEIIQIFKYLEAGAAVAGLGLSIILLQTAGVYRMFPKRKKEAVEWTDDIVKGLVQLILAPIIVMTITITAYLLFGNSEWFIKPF